MADSDRPKKTKSILVFVLRQVKLENMTIIITTPQQSLPKSQHRLAMTKKSTPGPKHTFQANWLRKLSWSLFDNNKMKCSLCINTINKTPLLSVILIIKQVL